MRFWRQGSFRRAPPFCAQYKPETFEDLAYRQACGKLVSQLGYPPEVLAFEYDCHYMVRGLAVDKARGNVIKMDRHKYVKLAFHGFRELSREERLTTYAEAAVRESYDEPDYALLDTLFSLGETYLFCQLVELRDARPELFGGRSYARMHADVRSAVDMCHRDGSLKRVVAANPGEYIYQDPALVPLLDMLRRSGRKVFLVTNSLWDYTHVVMNYLCEGKVGAAKSLDWTKRFDVIITGSAKPKFFENEREPIFAVDPATGNLLNTDNGAPLPHVGGSDPLASRAALEVGFPHVVPPGAGTGAAGEGSNGGAAGRGNIFQGGSYRHLHAMLGVNAGSQVLYVGDHIYGDGASSESPSFRNLKYLFPCCIHGSDLLSLQWCGARRRWGGAPRWLCQSLPRSCACALQPAAPPRSSARCAAAATRWTTSCSGWSGPPPAARARRQQAWCHAPPTPALTRTPTQRRRCSGASQRCARNATRSARCTARRFGGTTPSFTMSGGS